MCSTPHSNAVSSCIRNAVLLCFLGALQELQEQWERARAEEQSRGAGAADVRRWTGIRNIVEAREMLRTLFISACTQRAQVRPRQHVKQCRQQPQHGMTHTSPLGRQDGPRQLPGFCCPDPCMRAQQ